MRRAGDRGGFGLTRGIALAGLVLSGAMAAFATIAPPADAEIALMLARGTRREVLALRPEPAPMPAGERYFREDRFQRGDTVAALLARIEIAEPDAQQLARASALRLLQPGVAVRAEAADGGELLALEFLGSRDMLVRIRRDGSAFRASQERAPIELRVAMRSGVIRSSLFAASDEADIPDAVAMQLAEIFGGDIDFHRDLRSRDRFSVVYEMQVLDGRPLRAGRVLAAEFVNQRKTHRAVWFSGGYYDPAGRNLRKAFLRSPLAFSRVSSGFGMRRHPFLKAWRAHRGVDYAAPAGTGVRAVADGMVEFAGRNGGYGNLVVLRHTGRTTTLYAHLRGIARGVRPGARLAQGETVGFVGQTGWATGPHLHYEFRVGGEARNPLAVALPAAHPVAAHELPAYRSHATPLIGRLDLLAQSDLALLE